MIRAGKGKFPPETDHPHFVAHRGYSACYPENTLLSLSEALKAGAGFIEFDVQLCADLAPVVFHDRSLYRCCGVQKDLFKLSSEAIRQIRAFNPGRFGKYFDDDRVSIPTLSEVLRLSEDWPEVAVFVELKRESLDKFGFKLVVDQVMKVLTPISNQCCIISKSIPAMDYVKARGSTHIGWVLTEWTEKLRNRMITLRPDVIFCNHEEIPSPMTQLWSGPWKWGFYEISDPELARTLYARGASLIEVSDIARMLTFTQASWSLDAPP